MNIYPYVYRVDRPSGEFYIGYRCANTVPAEEDRSRKYKTSTRHLSYPFEEYTLTVLAEFFTATAKTDALDFKQATIYEHWGDALLANKACHYNHRKRFSTAGLPHKQKTRSKMSVSAMHREPQSEETKAKRLAALKGKPRSEEIKQKISLSRKGKTHSAETRAKISAANTGKTPNAESRAKMSASAKRRTSVR